MVNALMIFIGGGLGSLARWGVSGYVARHWGETFPAGTLIVNITGSFALGLFATLTGPDGRWLVEPITPVILPAGSYVLGATFLDADPDLARLLAAASTIAGVTFVQARQSTGCPAR